MQQGHEEKLKDAKKNLEEKLKLQREQLKQQQKEEKEKLQEEQRLERERMKEAVTKRVDTVSLALIVYYFSYFVEEINNDSFMSSLLHTIKTGCRKTKTKKTKASRS